MCTRCGSFALCIISLRVQKNIVVACDDDFHAVGLRSQPSNALIELLD